MSKKIVFDIDGVIRDLDKILIKKYHLPIPKEYYDWDNKGYNINDMINTIMPYAKPTEYLTVIKNYNKNEPLEFWTNQPTVFRKKQTKKWLKKYINRKFIIRFLTSKEKFKTLNKNIILVEDYPLFPNYKRIILIDRPYNKKVKAKIRIKSQKELRKILKNYE